MRSLVLCIVRGVYEQNSIVKNVHVNGWTTERAIIASNASVRMEYDVAHRLEISRQIST